MKYYAFLEGNDIGCDYTIACNKDLIELEASSLNQAKKELKEYLNENEPTDGWQEAIILECTKTIHKVFNKPEWTDEIIE